MELSDPTVIGQKLAIVARSGPSTCKKFFESFTVPIRKAQTRGAYCQAIDQFLAWVERAGYRDLEDIEPITVAAYIESLQRRAAPTTVKQQMAAIQMLFSWLTEKVFCAMNPAWEAKTQRHSKTERKTPALAEGQVKKRLELSRPPTPARATAGWLRPWPTLLTESVPW